MPVRTASLCLLALLVAVLTGCVVRRAGAPKTVDAAPVEVLEVAHVEVGKAMPPAAPGEVSDALPVAPAVEASARSPSSSSYDRPGFKAFKRDGRLWVFQQGSQGLDEFLKSGEPAKSVTLIGEGPGGMTLRGSEKDVLRSYMAAHRYGRAGYAVFLDDGRVWVFKSGSEDMVEFLRSGEPAKSVTLIGEGPDGKTLRSSDMQTARAFMAGR